MCPSLEDSLSFSLFTIFFGTLRCLQIDICPPFWKNVPCVISLAFFASGTLRKHRASAPPCAFPNFSFIFCTAFCTAVAVHSDSHILPTLCEREEGLKHSWTQRRTKEPLDESERGEWKTWLKTQRLKNEDYSIWSHHFMANRWGNNGNSNRLYFSWAPKSLQMVTAAMKLKDACSLQGKLWPT